MLFAKKLSLYFDLMIINNLKKKIGKELFIDKESVTL